MAKPIHIIVACSENRVIGRQRRLPWRIPEDLEYFHRETAGQTCILGRICFETWPRVRKDGRQPVVLTSRPLAGTRLHDPLAGARNDGPPSPLAGARSDHPLAHACGHDPLAGTGGHAPAAPGTGDPGAAAESAPIAVRTLAEGLAVADALPAEIYVCGGQRIYEETLALDRPMRLHLTLVHAEMPGDTFFPEWRHLHWRELSRRESADANYRYTFFEYERLW